MSKSSVPVPAPSGTKWVISETLIYDGGYKRTYFELGLWPQDAQPDKLGLDMREGYPTFSICRDLIWSPRQIRRASKRLLRHHRALLATEARAATLVGEVAGE